MNYLKEVWSSRELLFNLTSREVRGKYKRTVFGQLWSLVNPLALMLIYTFVFGFIFKSKPEPGNPSGLDIFPLWLLCGLLPWTFFSNVVSTSAGSLVANSGLIQKVSFSRVVLPLSTVGASAYNWGFEMIVLLIAISIAGGFALPWIPLVPSEYQHAEAERGARPDETDEPFDRIREAVVVDQRSEQGDEVDHRVEVVESENGHRSTK